MPIVIFLIGIAAAAASSSHAPMDHVFLRGLTSNKLTAATLRDARIARAVSTARRRATARDSFLGYRAPCAAARSLAANVAFEVSRHLAHILFDHAGFGYKSLMVSYQIRENAPMTAAKQTY
jgi:hypothetical protein